MEGVKPMKTPMHSSNPLSIDDLGKQTDQMIYRGMIDSLFYLNASRPNIIYSVCLYARFQSDSQESHLKFVKRIL